MRRIININQEWLFTGPGLEKKMVSLPHTWNAADGQDGGNNYYRGTCTYEHALKTPEFDRSSEQVYLECKGVNASAKVMLNGAEVCRHDGGYSTFRADITALLEKERQNDLLIEADNSVNNRVYPQKADFTFYGGIYRDVNLVIVNKNHFDLSYLGRSGIKVTAIPNGDGADVRIETFPVGDADETRRNVRIKIVNREGETVKNAAGTDCSIRLEKAHLWDGVNDPYLYTAVAELYVDDEKQDEISTRFGIRSFYTDPKQGFFLNGKSYPLRGVSRHQDWKGIGNALTKEQHDADMAFIREIGANTIRLAHYQHDQYFYDLCDEYGMVVWAEIPYISEHMPAGRENTVSQMKELITQNYNHPSIVCWGVSNEITISTKDKADMLDNHRLLNDLCHEMDKTRFTTLACYAMCGPFNKSAHITDVVSWNLYLGWYVPGLFLNDLWMRFFHLVYPKRCLGYSEYGCEAMPNLHAEKPRRGDHSEEYQTVYHEYMLRCFERNPYLWATHVWNMFDFAADARDQGGEPGMNHKGLVTFDRKIKKDSFYLYKAYWSKEPFVHICGKRFTDRTPSEIEVKVYSNQPEVALYLDGKLIGKQAASHIFRFRIPLTGEHELKAVSGTGEGALTDTGFLRKTAQENPAYRLNRKKGKSANWV